MTETHDAGHPPSPPAAVVRRTPRGRAAAIGTHCILELYDCPPDLLDDEAFIVRSLRGSVERGLAELIDEVSHHFRPQGVTALALIAESHVAIHTWPEHGYAAVDVFTCRDRADPVEACMYLVQALQAGRHTLTRLPRGTAAAPSDVVGRPAGTTPPTIAEDAR